MRALLPYLPFLIGAAVVIFTVVDIALIDPARVKYVPKFVWIIGTLLFTIIGAALWFLLGRERPSKLTGLPHLVADDERMRKRR